MMQTFHEQSKSIWWKNVGWFTARRNLLLKGNDLKDIKHLGKDILPAVLGADCKYLQSLGGGSKSKDRSIKDHKFISNSKDGKKVE